MALLQNVPIPTGGFRSLLIVSAVRLAVAGLAWLGAGPLGASEPHAPPANPPVLECLDAPPVRRLAPLGSTPYSIGEPTDEEQLYLEWINRARANPPAEGRILQATQDPEVLSAYQFFMVDLGLMVSQFDTNSPAPPLSFNEKLIQAARLHSGDMFTHQFQGHTGSDGSTLSVRLQRQGYAYSTAAENVFAQAESVFHGHAGFEVDWGTGPGGMQTPPGHRNNIHNSSFREIGVGVVLGSNGTVGPQLVTQDFGSRNGLTPFVTGVAYYDLNSNGAYDLGEGVGGVRIDLDGVSYYAVTAGSGGYSVPVPGSRNYTATFTATNLAAINRSVTVSGTANLKLDLVLPYSPPVLSGPSTAAVSQSVALSCSPVGAAQAYGLEQSTLTPFTANEGAENGLTTNLIATTTGSYAVIDTSMHATGIRSFHLAHATFEDQTLELNRNLRVGPTGALLFASQLGWATSNQVARAQVSLDGGQTWATVWNRAGEDTSGQTSFVNVSASLAAYAGQTVRVRFLYDYTGGLMFTQTDPGVGWYLDDLHFTDVEEQGAVRLTETGGTNLVFVPTLAAKYLLRVRPKVGTRWFPFGPAKVLTASGSLPLTAAIDLVQLSGPAALRFDCAVQNGTASSVQLEVRTSLTSPWVLDGSVQPEVITPGSRYRFTVPVGADPHRFYRARVNP